MKKVLIITYYWPPSGGGGVQRWLKFAKYLPEYGWEPIIYTPENPSFDLQDMSLLSEVSPETDVIKFPIWEPYQLFESFSGQKTPSQGLAKSTKKKSFLSNFALWVRGNFFIPDPRRFWVRPSIKFLTDFVASNEIDTIVTTGPPHSMHLIGLGLKKKTGIKWVADFRDPWSKWDMLNTFKLGVLAKWQHSRLELRVLKHADEVMTVSDTWADDFRHIYQRKYHVVTNGFDAEDFNNIQDDVSNDKLKLYHFGLINAFRSPKGFWDALKEYNQEVEVQLTGTVSDEIMEMIHSDALLDKVVDITPPIPHDQVVHSFSKADALLLILNNSENAKGHLPGKLFEYLASKRPILALGPRDSDAAKIIRETNTGIVVNHDNKQEILKALKRIREEAYIPNIKEIEKFSRKALTEKLVHQVLTE